jgi:Ni/Fe-hydrogenase subunit HybB-like protein
MLCVLSVVGAYLLSELIEINRIARLWMHGASFFRYQFTFLVFFGGVVTIYAIREQPQRRRPLSTLKLAAVCAVGAFLCAVLALFILPAFSARNILANLVSAEGRRALVVGAGLTLSWLTGILT